jgi:hypothetical protein
MMKTFERILIKAAIIQLLFLVLSQCFLHYFPDFPQLKQITKYEGVSSCKNAKTVPQ